MGASDEAMNALQNKWYNAAIKGLGLDANSFQFFQAQRPLGSTSEQLWTVFDSVPPRSLTQTQVLTGGNSFFANYESVVLTILPQGGSQFEDVMGDDLAAWNEYRKSLKPGDLPTGGVLQAFKDWAQLNLSPVKAAKAYAIFKQLQNGVVPRAVNAVLDDGNLLDGGPTYEGTIDALKAALDHGRSFSFNFDSSTESGDVSHTWAKGEIGGAYEFFSGEAGGGWDKLSQKAATAKVTITVAFDKVAVMTVVPGKWYHSDALNLAYKHADNTVWPAGQAPTWDDLFSEFGSLQRLAVEVVAFDGMALTMSSEATYSSEEREMIKASASVGFWPFFRASGEGGHETDTTFNDKGQMAVKSSVPRGNPALLGVNVLPIGQVIAKQEAALSPLKQSILRHRLLRRSGQPLTSRSVRS